MPEPQRVAERHERVRKQHSALFSCECARAAARGVTKGDGEVTVGATIGRPLNYGKAVNSHSAFSILHSAFCILHSAFSIQHSAFSILHSAFCILHSAFILRLVA